MVGFIKNGKPGHGENLASNGFVVGLPCHLYHPACFGSGCGCASGIRWRRLLEGSSSIQHCLKLKLRCTSFWRSVPSKAVTQTQSENTVLVVVVVGESLVSGMASCWMDGWCISGDGGLCRNGKVQATMAVSYGWRIFTFSYLGRLL